MSCGLCDWLEHSGGCLSRLSISNRYFVIFSVSEVVSVMVYVLDSGQSVATLPYLTRYHSKILHPMLRMKVPIIRFIQQFISKIPKWNLFKQIGISFKYSGELCFSRPERAALPVAPLFSTSSQAPKFPCRALRGSCGGLGHSTGVASRGCHG